MTKQKPIAYPQAGEVWQRQDDRRGLIRIRIVAYHASLPFGGMNLEHVCEIADLPESAANSKQAIYQGARWIAQNMQREPDN